MRYLAVITLLILAVAMVRPIAAQSFKPEYKVGRAAYNQRDYATALRHWRPLAEQGDARAQLYLGQMYRRGKGVTKDNSDAARCLYNRETLYRLG